MDYIITRSWHRIARYIWLRHGSDRLLLLLSQCFLFIYAWWRHQMETFSALLAICAGNSSVSGEFPAQRPVTRSFDVFFDVRLIKRLSKHSRGWWFGTLSHPLWRHRNGFLCVHDNGAYHRAVATIVLPCHILRSLQIVWRSNTVGDRCRYSARCISASRAHCFGISLIPLVD